MACSPSKTLECIGGVHGVLLEANDPATVTASLTPSSIAWSTICALADCSTKRHRTGTLARIRQSVPATAERPDHLIPRASTNLLG